MHTGLLNGGFLSSRFAEDLGGEPTIAVSTLITSVSIGLTVVMLVFSLWRGRKSSRVRPLFDVLRLIVQVAVATAFPLITGIVTAPILVGGAVLVGLAAGVMQGQLLTVEIDGDAIRARRSIAGFLVWGGGLVLMQVSGLANRTGLLEIGQAITWFSIGVGAGLLVGRHGSIVQAMRTAAVGLASIMLLSGVAVAVIAVEAPPAEAQGCPPGFEQGYFDEASQSQVSTASSYPTQCSKWVNGRSATYLDFRTGCDLADEWRERTGQSASDRIYAQSAGVGFILYANMIVRVQTVPASNGLDLEPAAEQYAQWFGPSCASAPPPTARPQPTSPSESGNTDSGGGSTSEPSQAGTPSTGQSPTVPDNGPAPPSVPLPTATPQIIVENLDPDAVPESIPIDDDGGSLFPPPTIEPAEEPTAVAQPEAVEGADEDDDDEQGALVAPEDPESGDPESPGPDSQDPSDSSDTAGAGATSSGATDDRNGGPDNENVSEDEALIAALAGLIASALAGVITFSEAISQAQQLLDNAGRDPGAARPLVEGFMTDQQRAEGARPESEPTTTRETRGDGTVTETTVEADGTRIEKTGDTTTVTRPDGTTVETRPGGLGGSAETETRPDGTVVTAVTHGDGTVEYRETRPDGTLRAGSVVRPDGSNLTSEDIDGDGNPDRTLAVAPDGTTVTTTRNAVGTYTIIEKRPDGSSTTVETQPDGTSVERTDNGMGSTTTTTTRPDHTIESTTEAFTGDTIRKRTFPDGTTEQETTSRNGTSTTVRKLPDGTTEETYRSGGGSRTTTTRPDGTSQTVIEESNGTTTELTKEPDGSSVEVETRADGTKVTTTFDARLGTTVYDERSTDGSRRTASAGGAGAHGGAIDSDGDGIYESFDTTDSKGKRTQQTISDNGTVERTETDAAGNVSKTSIQPDGTESTTTTIDGQTTEEISLPDGSKSVTTEQPDGSRTVTLTDPQNSQTVMTEHPDGSESAVFTEPDGTKLTLRLGADGTITTESDGVTTTKRPDGTVVNTTITPTGMETITERPDGTVIERNQSSSGRTIATETRPDKTSIRTVEHADGTIAEVARHPDGSRTETITPPNGPPTTTHIPRPDIPSLGVPPERTQEELLQGIRNRFNQQPHLAGPRDVNADEYVAYLQEIEKRFPNHRPADVLRALHAQEYEHDLGDANMPVPWDWPLFRDGSDGGDFREIYNELNLSASNQTRGNPVTYRPPKIVYSPSGERIHLGHAYAGPRSDMNRGDLTPAQQNAMRWTQTDGGDSWQVLLGSIPKTWRKGRLSFATEYAPPDQRAGNAAGVWLSDFYRSPSNKDVPVSEAFERFFAQGE